MNASEIDLASTRSSTIAIAPVKRLGCAATMRCMVVTQASRHASKLELSACDEGWTVDVFSTVEEAIRAAFRQMFQLAVVDLQSVAGGPCQTDFEQLARDLADRHVPLLVVAGDPQDPLAEFAARQLGVWIYLPGIDGHSQLDDMFREARVATERLAASKRRASEPVSVGKRPDT